MISGRVSNRRYTVRHLIRTGLILLVICPVVGLPSTQIASERSETNVAYRHPVRPKSSHFNKHIRGGNPAVKQIYTVKCTLSHAFEEAMQLPKSKELRPGKSRSRAQTENRSLWGALAIDANQGQAWGWAIDYPTVLEAEQRALSECGRDCYVVMTFRNQCAAFAADQERGSTIYGWAKHSTSASAKNHALNACRKRGGKSCIVRVWGCTRR